MKPTGYLSDYGLDNDSDIQVASKPISPDMPENGIYWVRWAEREHDWKLNEWDLIRLDTGIVEVFGTDETFTWDDYYSCVAVLGSKVEAPE